MTPTKTEYKYIRFEHIANHDWVCWNNKSEDILGNVDYYAPWKQYVFQPADMTEFSASCLLDIVNFLQQLNKR